MKAKIIIVVMATCFISTLNTAQGKITVKKPKKKNFTLCSLCPVKDGYNYLDPYNLKYLDPPSEKSAIFKELKNGDVTFKNFTFKKGAALNGTLTVDYYHSKFLNNHNSGGQIRARYKKGTGDPSNLRWVQMVNSQMPINSPPEKYPIIDPFPEDEPNKTNPDPNKYRPFYYNEEEIADCSNKNTFDLKFYDFSSRYHPPTSSETWTGDLYIASWDGNTPGTVTLHDGIKWGWVGACTNPEIAKWLDKMLKLDFKTPTTTSTDKVKLDYIGTKGTISNIITDTPGTITIIDGNSIEINWDEPLEPNTPISLKFFSSYQPVNLDGGLWYLEGVDVDTIEPEDVNLTVTSPPFGAYWLEVSDSTIPGSASWPGTGTGYDNGHWYYYPNSNWLNVWFDNRPFENSTPKLLKVKMTIEPLVPGTPYSATVVAGYSTDLWMPLGLDRPPLPDDVIDPGLETDYIHREEGQPAFEGVGIEPLEIQTEIMISQYNPEWTCVSVRGENLKITYGFAECSYLPTPTLIRTDFETDGTIDEYDLGLFCQGWLKEGSKYESDIDGDGTVNFKDFAVFAANWRQSEKASDPFPPDEEIDMPLNTHLHWTSGIGAVHHDIYLGENPSDVHDANLVNPMGVYKTRQDETEYEANLLPGTTYFWRIDEVAVNESDIEKGEVWSFTTETMP